MDELTPDQYQSVLKYMETTNEEDFQQATLSLQQHQFNLQRAVQSKFNPGQSRSSSSRASSRQSDQQIVRRYVEYMQKRNAEWSIISSVLSLIKNIILIVFAIFLRILPSSFRLKYFGSDFQKLYRDKLPHTFTSRSIPSLLKQTKNISSKSVLVLVTPNRTHSSIIDFLQKESIQKPIYRNFLFTGHAINHSQLSKIRQIQAPMLIALRNNIFDELIEVGRTKQLSRVDQTMLDRWAHQARNLFKRDCNVIIKYRNLVNRAFGVHYEEQEEQEVNLIEVQNTSREIQQQNRLYRQMEEEAKKNQQERVLKEEKQEEEKRQKQEFEAERQLRKSSIPPQPTEGNFIRFSFRCPDGNTILRNFDAEQSLDLVFQWVELNDDIEFQDEKRNFQIMYNYPPEPLSSKKDKSLSEIFQGSQQKLVIREL